MLILILHKGHTAAAVHHNVAYVAGIPHRPFLFVCAVFLWSGRIVDV